MGTLQKVMALIFRLLPSIMFDPVYALLFITLLFIIFNQYRKIYILQRRMFGLYRSTPLKDTLESLGYGFLGGIIASTLFVFLGFTLTSTGIIYIWLTALLLMLINPRFLCFSYAGGLVSLVYLIFGVPKVSVPSIMSLVAVLHLVESILIFLNGHKNPMPIYVKDDTGRVVGGFSLQRFWPLPLIAVLALVEPTAVLDGAISMPNWWPLLKPELLIPAGFVLSYQLFPIFAGLGYSDLVLSSTPESKTAYSARNLLFYSLILLALTMLADKFQVLEIVPVLFAPLGHELVIHYGRRQEKIKGSIFSHSNGVMVLDVYPNSPAEKMGLKSGDVILQVNEVKIQSPAQLLSEMSPWLIDPVFMVKNLVENTPQRKISYKGRVPPLGFIPVPTQHQAIYMVVRPGLVERLFKWWRQRTKE